MAIKIFNPEHDLALAVNSGSFIPPASASKMASDLSLLPYWYSQNDIILASHDMSSWQKDVAGQLNIRNRIICKIQDSGIENEHIEPWGWNKAIARKLTENGLKKIPAAEKLEKIRELSSRSFSIPLLREMRNISKTCGERYLITDISMLRGKSECIFKSLWSSSGKGIQWCKGNITAQVINRAEAEIKKYGGLVCEPIYVKVMDFAMEFMTGKGKTEFLGYSMFSTNTFGGYLSNEIVPNEYIESELCKYTDLETLESVKKCAISFISENIAHHYSGPLGIDMMICSGPEKTYLLHPCIEINMRMNMGILSIYIAEKTVSGNSHGKFHISFDRNPEKLKENDRELRQKFPLRIEDGKIVSGYFPLTPVYRDTQYCAYVIIRQNTEYRPDTKHGLNP